MTTCARSCCWVPMPDICARQRDCRCHWDERKGYAPTLKGGADAVHRDPTADQAIRNVMNEQEGRRG